MLRFTNAFKCKKCPETSNENGCPMWWEVILTNDDTKAQKVLKGCGYQLLPEMLAMTCQQAMHTTFAAYDMRNKVVKNVGKVIQAVQEQLKLDLPVEVEDGEIKFIEGEGEKEDGVS